MDGGTQQTCSQPGACGQSWSTPPRQPSASPSSVPAQDGQNVFEESPCITNAGEKSVRECCGCLWSTCHTPWSLLMCANADQHLYAESCRPLRGNLDVAWPSYRHTAVNPRTRNLYENTLSNSLCFLKQESMRVSKDLMTQTHSVQIKVGRQPKAPVSSNAVSAGCRTPERTDMRVNERATKPRLGCRRWSEEWFRLLLKPSIPLSCDITINT